MVRASHRSQHVSIVVFGENVLVSSHTGNEIFSNHSLVIHAVCASHRSQTCEHRRLGEYVFTFCFFINRVLTLEIIYFLIIQVIHTVCASHRSQHVSIVVFGEYVRYYCLFIIISHLCRI